MEKLVTVKELFREREKYIGQEVRVGGWVRSIRDSKTFGFLVLHDVRFLRRCRLFTAISWKTLRQFRRSA